MRTENWRLLPYDVGPSSRHFALSDALVRTITVPTVWWHATETPTVILGMGQRWEPDPESTRSSGVLVVRRQAGGTAVYAGPGVLGLDVALPAGHPLAVSDVVEAYRWLGEVWLEAVQFLGVRGQLVDVPTARAARPDSPYADSVRLACFGSLSPYEVTAGGRKLVGLAQVRRRAGILLQAGIHLHFDAEGLARVLAPGDEAGLASALRNAATGLDEVSPRHIDVTTLMTTVHQILEQKLDVRLVPGEWSEQEQAGPTPR